MTGITIKTGTGYSTTAPSEGYVLARRKGKRDGRVIIALHGANNTAATQWLPWHNRNFGGIWTQQLALAGRTVLAIDAGGPTSWANNTAMATIDEAVTWIGAQGYPIDQVGLLGWSMGGLTAMNYLKRHPGKIAGAMIFAPLLNLAYGHSTIDPTTVDAAYGGNYAVNSVGHDPTLEPQNYKGLAPVQIYHALNDSLVPIQQSRDWVAAVNDPNIKLTEVDTGVQAGHFAVHTQVPLTAPPLFFRAVFSY